MISELQFVLMKVSFAFQQRVNRNSEIVNNMGF